MKLACPSGCIEITYAEHESRDGRLLVSVDGNHLNSAELFALVENLGRKEKNLAEGRRRYANMAMAHLPLQCLDPDSNECATRHADS